MEEFSVSELARFREYSGREDTEGLKDLVSGNLASSNGRSYDIEPGFADKNTDHTLSILVHDSAVSLYELNEALDQGSAFDYIAGEILERAEDDETLDEKIIWDEVYGTPLNEVVDEIASYYAENFVQASDVETEKVLENNGFHGRADVLRTADDVREIRDIKTRYSDNIPIPGPGEEFKMACYALISRQDDEIDRFVLEYPLQDQEVVVEPEAWFTEVAEKANEFGELLENVRREQARILEDRLGFENSMPPRKFVEGLQRSYSENRSTARTAVTEALR